MNYVERHILQMASWKQNFKHFIECWNVSEDAPGSKDEILWVDNVRFYKHAATKLFYDLETKLKMNFECIKPSKFQETIIVFVNPASFIDDCYNSNHTVLSNPRGFLVLRPNKPSLHMGTLQTTAKDFSTCPWVLTTDPGKRFNVSWRVPSNSVLLTDSLDLVPLPG